MTDDLEIGKCPPWVNRDEVFHDVAAVMVKYGLTVGQFYDALGINLDQNAIEEARGPINRIADLRRELTLTKREH